MERKDPQKQRIPFSLKFIKMSTGQIVNVKEAVCTSSYNEGKTCNLLFLPSLQVRKIHIISIVEFNGQEVFF
ncbi:MAG: hypothetical protein K0B15_11845 [Lentimicrobium sp.]|nr:hypothetical protein [Lentimicrobium sp.]